MANKDSIGIPERLMRPHRYFVATREVAQGLKPESDYRLRLGPRRGIAHRRASRKELGRALRILQAIFTEAERRGHAVRAAESGYERSSRRIVAGLAARAV
jgi:hypothetical protein